MRSMRSASCARRESSTSCSLESRSVLPMSWRKRETESFSVRPTPPFRRRCAMERLFASPRMLTERGPPSPAASARAADILYPTDDAAPPRSPLSSLRRLASLATPCLEADAPAPAPPAALFLVLRGFLAAAPFLGEAVSGARVMDAAAASAQRASRSWRCIAVPAASPPSPSRGMTTSSMRAGLGMDIIRWSDAKAAAFPSPRFPPVGAVVLRNESLSRPEATPSWAGLRPGGVLSRLLSLPLPLPRESSCADDAWQRGEVEASPEPRRTIAPPAGSEACLTAPLGAEAILPALMPDRPCIATALAMGCLPVCGETPRAVPCACSG
mmetsp:Transcript_59989/g.190557  ORF Transcript_59989/g.190557 Transcript_59989/m.190557 type:complete len:327 (+) Transcript_59989:1059-2039(+)